MHAIRLGWQLNYSYKAFNVEGFLDPFGQSPDWVVELLLTPTLIFTMGHLRRCPAARTVCVYVSILKTIWAAVWRKLTAVLEIFYQSSWCPIKLEFTHCPVFLFNIFIQASSCKLNNPPSCSLVLTRRVQAEQLKMLNGKGENERKD